MSQCIRVWPFYEAPEENRKLSRHGGDEDWLAHVPHAYTNDRIPWMESGRAGFGVCDVSQHVLPDGSVIRIGAHA